MSEALAHRDSFLFHEAEGYESGLIGYHKPLSHAMFGNYRMVEDIGTLLDPDVLDMRRWESTKWKAYCRIVLITLADYIERGHGQHSSALHRAKSYIERAPYDLYKLDGMTTGAFDEDVLEKLRVVVDFIKGAIKLLDQSEIPPRPQLRVRGDRVIGTLYDDLADMILEIIHHASTVRSPATLCWWVQHNSLWYELFNFNRGDGAAAKIVQFKVRRLIYQEVTDMRRAPNFKGAHILGFCLNVLGFEASTQDYFRDSKALHKVILSWTRRHFSWLYSYNPRVAEACLVDGITYDAAHHRLVKTSPAEGLRRTPEVEYFDVEPARGDETTRDAPEHLT